MECDSTFALWVDVLSNLFMLSLSKYLFRLPILEHAVFKHFFLTPFEKGFNIFCRYLSLTFPVPHLEGGLKLIALEIAQTSSLLWCVFIFLLVDGFVDILEHTMYTLFVVLSPLLFPFSCLRGVSEVPEVVGRVPIEILVFRPGCQIFVIQ